MLPTTLLDLAGAVLDRCRRDGLTLTTAESCTGGLIAACLTEIAGSSAVVDRGFVTYSNRAKTELLGVPDDLLREHGAVSEPVARAMAEGALARSGTSAGIAVTGVAGPGGGTTEKPIGLVHIALAREGAATAHARHVFAGDRTAVRVASVEAALRLVLESR